MSRISACRSNDIQTSNSGKYQPPFIFRQVPPKPSHAPWHSRNEPLFKGTLCQLSRRISSTADLQDPSQGVTKESEGCSQITQSKKKKAWLPENIRVLFQNRASILGRQSNRCPQHSPVTVMELNSLSLTLQPSTQGCLKFPFLPNISPLSDSLLTMLCLSSFLQGLPTLCSFANVTAYIISQF